MKARKFSTKDFDFVVIEPYFDKETTKYFEKRIKELILAEINND